MKWLFLLVLLLPACDGWGMDYTSYAKRKASLKYKCPVEKIETAGKKKLTGSARLVHLVGCGKEFYYICQIETFSCTANECYEVIEK